MEDGWSNNNGHKNQTYANRCKKKKASIVHAPALLVHVQLSNDLHNLNSFFCFFSIFDEISNGFSGWKINVFFSQAQCEVS